MICLRAKELKRANNSLKWKSRPCPTLEVTHQVCSDNNLNLIILLIQTTVKQKFFGHVNCIATNPTCHICIHLKFASIPGEWSHIESCCSDTACMKVSQVMRLEWDFQGRDLKVARSTGSTTVPNKETLKEFRYNF